jgi:cytoskeletal protein RodZ
MSKETNKEMDLLLRRLGRRKHGSVSDADHIDDDHLDADELSSYAENALPAGARTRYSEHLAECSRCRDLVVQLSSAVGVVTESITETAALSGLRKFLASLFSPMVLRYAVPALGLIVVAAIGFRFLRQQNREVSVARLEPQVETKNTAAPNETAPTFSYDDRTDHKSIASPSATPQTKQLAQAQPLPPNAPPAVSVDTEVKEPPAPKVEDQALASATPVQSAAKPAAETDESRRKVEAEARRERADEPAKNEVRKMGEFSAARPAKSKTQPLDRASAPGTGSVANVQREGADKDDAGETRAVAGRRFRKGRGIWIDTAYDSSMRPTNVTRGSEQYRALIADEPAIKTIAEQLDGEIIVVWNGRAYRIH